MKTRTKIASTLIVALGLAGSGVAIAASQTSDHDAVPTSNFTFDQAAAIALEAQPGTVYEVELETEDGRSVFEVELMAEAGEYEVTIDAMTGEVLEVEKED